MDQRRHFDIAALADGVWAAVHPVSPVRPDAWAIGNAGIVDLGDETLVFDATMTPASGADLAAAAEELTGRPVTTLVISHHHNDHVWGAQAFADAELVASRPTAALLDKGEMEEMRDIRAERLTFWEESAEGGHGPEAQRESDYFLPYWRGLDASLPDLAPRPPDRVFGGGLALRGSDRSIELMSLGRGHTRDDLVLRVADAGVVFTGDLLFSDAHPFFPDGELEGLRRAWTGLESINAQVYVPGHGPPAGVELISVMRTYLADVERAAQARPQERAMPAHYREWVLGRFFDFNVRFAAGELGA